MEKLPTETPSDIAANLGLDQSTAGGQRIKRWVIGGALLAAAIAAASYWQGSQTVPTIQFKTQEVRRGDLTVNVTATGNLQPTNLVDVGIEVSGTIASVDVDYNDQVKLGQTLAKLDTTKLEAQVLKSKAALEATNAQVLQAQATEKQAKAELARLEQVRKLSGGKVPSQNDLEAAEAALLRAQADLANANAAVTEAKANLESVQTDLAKAVIRSPIDGVVLKRAVEPGQTVAASFQAPVLFTLAQDLTKMELHVDVDEADVGQVQAGQDATFTVDAYPDRVFPAQTTQVRYASREVQGVITYETLLAVDNADLALRPGMTATADITVKKVTNALLVPNAALRFTPPHTDPQSERRGGILDALLPRWRPPSQQPREDTGKRAMRRVWVIRDNQPVAMEVKVGATDGLMTEVIDGDLPAGSAVAVDVLNKKSSS